MRVVFVKNLPINLLVKNAVSRGNIGLTCFYIFVMALVDYLDGDSFSMTLEMIAGIVLLTVILRAFKAEMELYMHILLDILHHCTQTGEPLVKGPAGEDLPIERQACIIAAKIYADKEKELDEEFRAKNRAMVWLGNIALVMIILGTVICISRHL